MNRYIIILSILSVTAPLSGQMKIDLRSDESLTKVFDETELKGLESMVRFVDTLVLDKVTGMDTNKAYHVYFDELSKSSQYIVPFEEKVKYQFLQSLDSTQFATVWNFTDNVDMISLGDTVYRNLENFKILNVRPYSKFMDYLEEIGKEDLYYGNLRREFANVGSLTRRSSAWFMKNHDLFDFMIPKNRLWAVVYILQREDTYEMKLHRWLTKNQ